jgi:Holliday junction resolvase RusA-like endonuclease
MSAYNADLAHPERPRQQERMSAADYRASIGAPPKREAKPMARVLPEPTPQDLVKLAASQWPAVSRLAVDLPEPPSLNNAYENTGGNGRRKSKKLLEFYREATAALATFGQRLDAETYRAHIVVTRTNVRADIDGKAKFILDVLGKCGITPDDRNCEKVTIEWRYRGEPGASVMLDRYAKRRAA